MFGFSERERNRLRAQKALASGKTREAEQFFQKAIEITPDMVLNVIRVRFSYFFMHSNVDYFVYRYFERWVLTSLLLLMKPMLN